MGKDNDCGCTPTPNIQRRSTPMFESIGDNPLKPNALGLTFPFAPGGVFTLPKHMTDDTPPYEPTPRPNPNNALGIGMNAVFAEASRVTSNSTAGSTTGEYSQVMTHVELLLRMGSPFGAMAVQQEGDDDVSDPRPPKEPAASEDCDKWADAYLKWLNENWEEGIHLPTIVIRCKNKTYTFRRVGKSEEYNIDIDDYLRELRRITPSQLGDPADTSWKKDGKPPEVNDHVDLTEAERPKAKRVLSSPNQCSATRVRATQTIEFEFTFRLEFSYVFIVPDSNGAPDQDKIDMYALDLQDALSNTFRSMAKGRPKSTPPGSDNGDYRDMHHSDVMPDQAKLFVRLKELCLAQANLHFACDPKCKLVVEILKYTDFAYIKEPNGDLPDDRWPYLKSGFRQGAPVRKKGYWEVEITAWATWTRWIRLTIVYDIQCVDR